MTSKLQDAIKQTQPFGSREQEAMLLLQRTASALSQMGTELLKAHGVTPSQYNVLRILRGSAGSGLACREIGERMVTRDPDVTRLLDRMEKQGLIERTRDTRDRRVVVTRITPRALDILAALDEPMAALHLRQLGHLGAERLATLIELLEQVAPADE